MADPYRTPKCPTCGGDAASTIECLHCRAASCAACAIAGVCVPCVARALDVANRVLAERHAGLAATPPPPRARPRFGHAIALGSFLGTLTAWVACFLVQGAALRELDRAVGAHGAALHLARAAESREAKAPAGRAPTAPLPPTTPGAPADPDPTLPSPARLLATAGPPTNDPRELLARAERLRAAGLDVTIVRSELSRAAAFGDALAPFGGHIEPVARDGGVVGVALRGFPRDATPIAAGLANGDVVTSVNGVPIGTPGLAADALAAVRRSGRAVVEVLRGSRRVVLVVDWPTV